MTVALDRLNALSDHEARREFARCCGSERWAAAMAARRPFPDVEALQAAADEIWFALDGSDWLEAFSHHPRIGARAGGWAREEQSGARGASPATLKELADLNHEYERRFGHVFLICATGLSAGQMLEALKRRLGADPASELRVAAAEQARITRLRLEKLLAEPLERSRTG